MIKNFIFDFGQVLVEFNTEYMTSVYFENKAEIKTVEEVVFDRLYWDKLDEGSISDDQVRQGIKSRLPKELHEKACLVYDNWYKNLPFIKGMTELISEIKQNGGRIFLLSNISEAFADNYHTVPEIKALFDKFDGLVFSSKLGLTKPDKEIFKYLLRQYNLNARECVFIDDRVCNTLGAERIGIKSILFSACDDKFKTEIKKYIINLGV